MSIGRLITKMDYRFILVIGVLMLVSLYVISATDPSLKLQVYFDDPIWTTKTIKQLQRFFVSWLFFFGFALLDYHKIREWVWILYLVMLLLLLGLFLAPSIQGVHRWYRIPWVNISFQPSEWAKIVAVMTLSWFLEKTQSTIHCLKTTLIAFGIIVIPALLIYKQPDLGTSMVLIPICFALLYLGGGNRLFLKIGGYVSSVALIIMLLVFLKVLPEAQIKPYALKVLKPYQYERLNPDNHHQKAAQIAIGVGGIKGTGWRKSLFTSRGWLPYAYTDSVFPAFGEERGLLGLFLILGCFYALIMFAFEVITAAKDEFGRFLAAGIAVYLAMHVLMNIAMMCGLFPITGIPLIIVSYGGSSLFVTMSALGILQSIYMRRFIF